MAPGGNRTHPMSEKARGGLFNALGDIAGLSVLDAFAGSGALSFEAISRGAKHALAIDIDNNATTSIKRVAKDLGIEKQVKVIRANVSAWSDNNPDQKFDIVLCDPPFDQLQIATIQKLVKHLPKDGLAVLSWPGNLQVPELEAMTLIKDKNYGDNQLAFYRKAS